MCAGSLVGSIGPGVRVDSENGFSWLIDDHVGDTVWFQYEGEMIFEAMIRHLGWDPLSGTYPVSWDNDKTGTLPVITGGGREDGGDTARDSDAHRRDGSDRVVGVARPSGRHGPPRGRQDDSAPGSTQGHESVDPDAEKVTPARWVG